MKIKKAGTHGFYDVFIRDGWYNHTRVQVIRRKGDQKDGSLQVKFVSGRHLSPSVFKQVSSVVISQL